MGKRASRVRRKTRETDISVSLNIGGKGKARITTGIAFLDHMLELFAFHGFFDLDIAARGDLEVDIHHTNEDIGIALGEAFKKALGDRSGIRRFGAGIVPMDETLVQVVMDISGRPELVVHSQESTVKSKGQKKDYGLNDAKQLLKAFVNTLGINLHIQIIYGEDMHHILEAVFKGLGRAMDEATQIEARKRGIPSTKGRLG